MKISLAIISRLAFLSITCFIFSCATQSTYKQLSTLNPGVNQTYIDSGILILVLPADISYESIYNEAKLDYGGSTEHLKAHLEGRMLTILGNKGFRIKSMNQISDESGNFDEELKDILNNSTSMFKAYIDEQLQETIKNFGEKSDIPAMMVFNCEVKVGSGDFWNPFSGQITSHNNRTILKAVLLNTSDCRKLWSNQTQLRELPQVGDAKFDEAIDSVFNNLKSRGE